MQVHTHTRVRAHIFVRETCVSASARARDGKETEKNSPRRVNPPRMCARGCVREQHTLVPMLSADIPRDNPYARAREHLPDRARAISSCLAEPSVFPRRSLWELARKARTPGRKDKDRAWRGRYV